MASKVTDTRFTQRTFFSDHDFYGLPDEILPWFYTQIKECMAVRIGNQFILGLGNPPDLAQPLLDFGCGNGWATFFVLQRASVGAVGIDFSARHIRMADERAKIGGFHESTDFVVGDLTKLPFRDSCFDSLICVNVLHHLPQLSSGVRAVRNLLREGGQCWVMEQVANNPLLTLGRSVSKRLRINVASGEELSFTDRDVQNAFLSQGFRITCKGRDGFFLWLIFVITARAKAVVMKVPRSLLGSLIKVELALEKIPIINSFAGRTLLICRKVGS